MKRILIAAAFFVLSVGGPALAADLSIPAGAAPVPYYKWGGAYAGLNGGYGFGTVSPTTITGAFFGPVAPTSSSFNANGFLFGGTLGGNYQIGSFVLGIEGDIDYNGATGTVPALGNSFTSNWLATVRGRAGYAWDRVLLYATGGGAFSSATIGPNANFIGGASIVMGWAGGGGLEFAFAQNWTAKAEYLYVSFPGASIIGINFKQTENLVRAGVNYKF